MIPKRVNFVSTMVNKYKAGKNLPLPREVVGAFTEYYGKKYDRDIKNGKRRKLSCLSSIQTNLSQFKREMRELGASEQWLKGIHMDNKDTSSLIREKSLNVRANSIDLTVVNGDNMIKDCRKLLDNSNIYLQLIALACLTGRRTAELLFSTKFGPPGETHFTDSKYWSCITGILKQRGEDRTKCREIPLFVSRSRVNLALERVRANLPVSDIKDVNKLYGKSISRAMKKYCPEIGNIHQFRKFYALMCFHYFNERHCSLPRLASDYLGHKTMSDTVLTYLNFRVDNLGTLSFRSR